MIQQNNSNMEINIEEENDNKSPTHNIKNIKKNIVTIVVIMDIIIGIVNIPLQVMV